MSVLIGAQLLSRLRGASRRRLARWFGRRMFKIQCDEPIISFTFDDFPRSALVQGGAILCEHRFAGTYYASFGLMGRVEPTGEIFSRADFPELSRQGHELGCHTFDHCDAWDTASVDFEASIMRNQRFVNEELPGVRLMSLSYPISYPRPQTKHRTAKYYACARGGGQTFNVGMTDVNYLKAFFLEQSRDDFGIVQRTIDANRRAKGWLIFATHDVCDSPTRFGCSPCFFKQVIEYAASSGSMVLPVYQAWNRIRSQRGLIP